MNALYSCIISLISAVASGRGVGTHACFDFGLRLVIPKSGVPRLRQIAKARRGGVKLWGHPILKKNNSFIFPISNVAATRSCGSVCW
jgi:hypothetical protein